MASYWSNRDDGYGGNVVCFELNRVTVSGVTLNDYNPILISDNTDHIAAVTALMSGVREVLTENVNYEFSGNDSAYGMGYSGDGYLIWLSGDPGLLPDPGCEANIGYVDFNNRYRFEQNPDSYDIFVDEDSGFLDVIDGEKIEQKSQFNTMDRSFSYSYIPGDMTTDLRALMLAVDDDGDRVVYELRDHTSAEYYVRFVKFLPKHRGFTVPQIYSATGVWGHADLDFELGTLV
jgi:hypothetical protein